MSIAEELKAVLQSRDAVTMRGDYDVELFAKRMKNGELALSMKCAGGWELIVLIGADGAVKVHRVLFDCVAETFAAMLRDEAQKPADVPQEVAPATSHVPHFKAIKRAFAIAAAAGLDTRADVEMRAACGGFLGRTIESRAAMNSSDWYAVGDAVKAHYLTW